MVYDPSQLYGGIHILIPQSEFYQVMGDENPWPRALPEYLRNVEPIEGYFPSLDKCTKDQKLFYGEWSTEYKLGRPYLAPIGFLIIHCYQLIQENWNSWAKCALELAKMSYAYEFVDEKLSKYAIRWCADACIANEKYELAIWLLQRGFRPGTHTLNEMFNLRYFIGLPMNEVELLRQAVLGRKGPTKFAIENIREVAAEVRVLLDQFRFHYGEDAINYIANKYPSQQKYNIYIFNGTNYSTVIPTNQRIYCFYAIKEFLDLIQRISRQAENIVRHRHGKRILPNDDLFQIGEKNILLK